MRTQEDVEKLLDRLESFFNEYDAGIDEFNRNEFHKRNGEKLGKYADIMKKLNGKDFDIFKESFDEYNRDFKDMEEDAYIAKLTAVLDEQLKDLKDALGVSEVEVKSDENGTEIEAKDESEEAKEETKEDEDKAEETEEEKKAEETEEETEDKAEETEEEELDRIAKSIKKPF